MYVELDRDIVQANSALFWEISQATDAAWNHWRNWQPSQREAVLSYVDSKLTNGSMIDQSVSAQVSRKVREAFESGRVLEFIAR